MGGALNEESYYSSNGMLGQLAKHRDTAREVIY